MPAVRVFVLGWTFGCGPDGSALESPADISWRAVRLTWPENIDLYRIEGAKVTILIPLAAVQHLKTILLILSVLLAFGNAVAAPSNVVGKSQTPLAVVFVIDKSASMKEDGRIEAARNATLAGIRALHDNDYVGVVAFDAGPFIVVDVDRVSAVRTAAEKRLWMITPFGKTNLLPALAVARMRLQKVEAQNKHIIIISDQKSNAADTDVCLSELARINQEKISVSSFAWPEDGSFLKALASSTHSSYHELESNEQLEKDILSDIEALTGRGHERLD